MRAAVVDDHEAIRLGLRAALAQHRGQVVLSGEAATVDELIERAPGADVVLLDLLLGDDSDPKVNVERLHRQGYKVLVYSIADNLRLVRQALAGGARGVCRKAEPIAETVAAITAVAHGDVVISQEILAAIESDTQYVAANLGPRERQVLGLYAAGLEIPDISRELSIAENSVKEYLKRIRLKYSQLDRPASNKLDLFRRAIEDGIVPPVEPRA
ncbi:MAG: response regulator transcription factor [Micropruina sp.]|nr:MAG: response regulator transcription factor [Micropruina sp.]